LVSCPVALYSVREAAGDLHFHLINPKTGHRVRMISVDAETEQEVSRRDLVKGFEFEKDRYVLLDESDFDSARIESSSTINVESFVPTEALDPIYFESTYYMAPDGNAGSDVYVVLREAIAKTKRTALSRVVLSQRERMIAISPSGQGLVARTLHEMQDVRQADEVFAAVPRDKPAAEMVDLAVQLIERQSGKFNPAVMQDRYEARLRELIDAKLRGKGLQPGTEADGTDRSNVIDLMSALKQSLRRDAVAGSRPSVAKKPSLAKKTVDRPTEKNTKNPRTRTAQRKTAHH
jgi:DNA end-binding protein Ku